MISSLETSLKRGILSSSKAVTGQCGVQYQSVRHARKPRWIPMAKTKMYKVIDCPAPPKMEFEETTRLYKTYQLYNRSLWAYQGNISREVERQQLQDAKQVSEEVELERMFLVNDAVNEKIRRVREASLEDEWKEVERNILEEKRQREEKKLEEMTQVEAEIKQQLRRLAGAIDQKDLDEVIDKALSMEFDYNYAISKNGNILLGRFNNTDSIDMPPPQEPLIQPTEASK